MDHGSVTIINNGNGKTAKIITTSATVVDKATVGATADITPGAQIMIRKKHANDADEIIVLLAGSKFGTTSGGSGG